MANKKDWQEKMLKPEKGEVSDTKKGKMYISTPREIQEIIKKVSKGKLTTTKEIAQHLTSKKKVDFTCPLTTGIFTSIVANAAQQRCEMGSKSSRSSKPDVPYWRVIKAGGKLYDKYLGSKLPQKKLLKEEDLSLKSPETVNIGK